MDHIHVYDFIPTLLFVLDFSVLFLQLGVILHSCTCNETFMTFLAGRFVALRWVYARL